MSTANSMYNVKNIKPIDLLLQQPPFLFVDRIIDFDGETITCSKMLSHNETYFSGHFPGNPIMPGVLLIEMAAQASLLLMMIKNEILTPLKGYLVKTEDFTFINISTPGDELLIRAKIIKKVGSYYTASATIQRKHDKKKLAKGSLIFYLPEEMKL